MSIHMYPIFTYITVIPWAFISQKVRIVFVCVPQNVEQIVRNINLTIYRPRLSDTSTGTKHRHKIIVTLLDKINSDPPSRDSTNLTSESVVERLQGTLPKLEEASSGQNRSDYPRDPPPPSQSRCISSHKATRQATRQQSI